MSEIIGAWIGGSYSPPTFAHIEVARAVGEYLVKKHHGSQIQIYFVPVSEKYKKASVKNQCVSEVDRLNMLKIAAESVKIQNVEFLVSDHEINYGESNGKAMSTYNSLTKLKEITGIKTMYLVQGQDNIENILKGKWANTTELLCKSNILGIPRDNINISFNNEQLIQNKFKNSSMKINNIMKYQRNLDCAKNTIKYIDTMNPKFSGFNSSKLRKYIRENNITEINKMTHPSIIKYIQDKNLYTSGKNCEELPKMGGKRTRRKKSRKI